MRQAFINKIRKLLITQQADIINRMKHVQGVDIDVEGDDVDVIQGRILAHTASQLMKRDTDKLTKIQVALNKIADGTFGACEECGEGISEKRLLINPGFITCIMCAEELERVSKRRRAN